MSDKLTKKDIELVRRAAAYAVDSVHLSEELTELGDRLDRLFLDHLDKTLREAKAHR